MSAHVLLNLLNDLRQGDKMRDLSDLSHKHYRIKGLIT